MNKKCSKCGQVKPFDNFYPDPGKKDGRTSQCKACMREYRREYWWKNREREKEKSRQRYHRNADEYREKSRENYWRNVERERERRRRWVQRNRELNLNTMRCCYHKNPSRYIARSAERRAAKRQATPIWLTTEHLQELHEIYENCPPGWHVDHIVPLISAVVCGLHVPWNLQYLTPQENRAKGNRLLPDKDEEE